MTGSPAADQTLPPAVTESVTGTFDLASIEDHVKVRRIADTLVSSGVGIDQIKAMDSGDDAPLDLRLATKLALSKHAIDNAGWTGRVGVVFAMWGEQRRLRPRSPDNPTGEDALRVKLDQLEWLFEGTNTDWRVYPVDDGDPDDSGTVAEERASKHPEGTRVTVLRLGDVIPTSTGPLSDLDDVDDSRKGGAIVLGASVAMEDGCDVVVMTDADNSVNLGQTGLLIAAHAEGANVVIGDRKHPEAVLVKAEARWGPGIVVLRHMQRMVGRALFSQGIRDTQAAFKLYDRTSLDDILAAPSTYGFAFDSDWLYGALSGGHSIDRVPFAFIDSFEESASLAQGPMTTWESLLRGLVDAARARGVDHNEEMAQVVDDHAHASELDRVVEAVPPQLDNVPDASLGDPSIMTPTELRSWLEDLDSEQYRSDHGSDLGPEAWR
ncbi:MAG: glycosyltransferase [Acidimicrobiia bacterium]